MQSHMRLSQDIFSAFGTLLERTLIASGHFFRPEKCPAGGRGVKNSEKSKCPRTLILNDPLGKPFFSRNMR